MRRLEDILDLPEPEDTSTDVQDTEPAEIVSLSEAREILHDADQAIDKINVALPTINDLVTSDSELDEIAKLAQEKFEDLVELGCNVDPRNSGPILQAASSLLGHALSAKMAKMDKKLKIIDLQLKKARLDHMIATSDVPDKPEEGHGTVLNRNELLKQIMDQTKNAKTNK